MSESVVGQLDETAQSTPVSDNSDSGDLSVGPVDLVQTDSAFNQAEFDLWSIASLKKRDETYSNILDGYYSYTQTVLSKNPKRQGWFFVISLIILFASPFQFIVCLFIMHDGASIVPILASAAEAIGAVIVFPKIIAEYLFNTNEITSINNVVTAIQNYDISIRTGIRHTSESESTKE